MTKPTAAVRSQVMDRDGHRCVAGFELGPLEFQHRQAVGMGGSLERPGHDSKRPLCIWHAASPSTWVPDAAAVPVLYWQERSWCRLTVDGFRVFISQAQALAMMHAVYGADVYEGWRSEL